MTTLADRLKVARIRKGLTQTELAKAAGLKNQSIIGSLESGYRKSSAYTPAIAEALDIPAIWLSDGKGPNPFTTDESGHPEAAPATPPLPTTRGRARSPLRAAGSGAAAKAALADLAAELETHPPDVETERRLAQEIKLQVEWLKAIREK